MRKRFFYLMVILPIFTIIFLSLAILYIDSGKYKKITSYYNQHILEDFVNDNKKTIKDRVEFVNAIIEFESKQLEEIIQSELTTVLTMGYQVVDDIYQKNKDTLPKDQIIKKIIDTISKIKYDNGRGYFYIFEYSKEFMLWHPLDSFKGIDISNSTDSRGTLRTKVLKDSLSDGSKYGFAKFYIAKPDAQGNTKEYSRLSGIFHYKPLDISIGTGEFLDYIRDRLKEQVKQRVKLLNIDQKIGVIRLIKYDEMSEDFDCVLATQPCSYLVKNTTYPQKLKDIVMDVNTGYKGFIKFTDESLTRYVYYLYHKDWNWVIQSDFYEDDMMYSLNSIQNHIKDDEERIFKNSLFIILLCIAVTLIISFIVLNRLRTVMFEYTQEIKDQKDELEIIFSTTKDGIAIFDMQTNYLFFNEAYLKIIDIEKDELISAKYLDIVAQEDIVKVKRAIEETKVVGYFENLETTYIVKDNKRLSVNISMALLPDKQRILISIRDISEARRKQRQIKNYISLIDKYLITSSTDLQGNITHVSEALANISGYEKDEMIGKDHSMIRHPDMPKELFKEMWQTILANETWIGEIKNKKKDGGYYWVDTTISANFDEYGHKIGYTSIKHDITNEKLVEKLSLTDGLTDVFNRRHFDSVTPKIINSAKRKNELLSFIIMDIDHFKQYNDTYGHQAGDDALKSVAKCIEDSLNRADDHCFRLGGEEFGVLFKSDDVNSAVKFANKIKQNIEDIQIVHEQNTASKYITVSMGLICEYASKIKNQDDLYKIADDLLYEAKDKGRNTICSLIEGE